MPHAHTLGVWIAGNASNGRIFKTWGIFANGKRIATVQGGPDVANARLMAAAPELLSALELALATIERLKPSKPYNSTQGTRDVINNAITRATGRERGA